MVMPNGWTWQRNWYSLARLSDGEDILGEVQLHNGTWYGLVGGRVVDTSEFNNQIPERLMSQVVEVALRTI